MKNLKILFTLFIAVGLFSTVNAQKIKVKSGDLGVLKGQTALNVEYDYSSTAVGKFKTQEEYLEDGAQKREEKEAGAGQKFKDSWYNAQKEKYPEKFEELMNKGLEKKGIKVGQNMTDAKYTLIVKTTFTEPGFNVGVMRQPAYTNMTLLLVETANKENIVCEATADKSPGQDAMGFDFDASYRIAESYAKCGKTFAGVIAKATK